MQKAESRRNGFRCFDGYKKEEPCPLGVVVPPYYTG